MNTDYVYNLGQLFNEISAKNQKKVAIKSTDLKYTNFERLNSYSNKIANLLVSKNIKKNDVVAILNNKTEISYSLMIACLKIGAIYTNLDSKSPIERFNKMMSSCMPKLLLYYNDDKSVINEFNNKSIELIDYSSIGFKNKLNEYKDELPKENNNVCSSTPAYIMFTSGSTGFPKGVLISHQNVINFIKWSKDTYKITTQDVFTNINPMHFDNSVFDFFASLFNGASIIPIHENTTRNPRKLLDELNNLKPTIWFSVPSMLVYVLNMRALKEGDLPTLRTVTFGGEGFPKNQLRKLWSYWGDRVRFVNVYGPTECTCICSSYDVVEADMKNDELLPLGHMSPNFYGLTLDDFDNEIEYGEIGELCIGGPNVGMGYYNNANKTEEVFIRNSTIESFKEFIYKTGDLVRQDKHTKMYLFCGRKDNQIKRMGYRIELEEIENALNVVDSIKESAVIYLNTEKYKSKIVACLNSNIKDDNIITEVLKNYLPSYMLPDLYFYYNTLPKNQNGKIDRLTLKKELL